MLKLHAGVSKKVGLPGLASASANCTIEAELDGALLNDTQGFQMVVRRAYQSCEKAVQDQIARLTGTGTSESEPGIHESQAQPVAHEIIEVQTSPAIRGAAVSRVPASRNQPQIQPSPRPATASQVKAIRAIAARRRIDLAALLRERFGLQTAYFAATKAAKHSSRLWAGVRLAELGSVGLLRRREARLHQATTANRKRGDRIVQPSASRRLLEPALFPVARGSTSRDRGMKRRLQWSRTAWGSGQPDAVGVRAAGRLACPPTGPAWRAPRLASSWGQRDR